MPDLFPTFDVPAVIDDSATANVSFPKGPAIDPETGDFAADGAGRISEASGYDTWVVWCIKCIATQRGAYLAFDDSYGTEREEAMDEDAHPDRDSKQAALQKAVTDALLADPLGRTSAVRDFAFSWDGDSGSVSCTVEAADGSTAGINTQI